MKKNVEKVDDSNATKINNGGLMKKTKAQLIDIIFRKDAVEKDLQGELKRCEDIIIELGKKHEEELTDCYQEAIKDYSETVKKEYDSIFEDLRKNVNSKRKKINKYKLYFVIAAAVALIELVFIVFC